MFLKPFKKTCSTCFKTTRLRLVVLNPDKTLLLVFKHYIANSALRDDLSSCIQRARGIIVKYNITNMKLRHCHVKQRQQQQILLLLLCDYQLAVFRHAYTLYATTTTRVSPSYKKTDSFCFFTGAFLFRRHSRCC